MNRVASSREGTSGATYASAAGSLDSALVAASVPPCPKITTTADLDTAGKLCGASNDASQESGKLPYLPCFEFRQSPTQIHGLVIDKHLTDESR